MSRKQQITVLGATGSIGVNSLDVIALHPERYQVFALTAKTQTDKLLAQCLQFQPRYAVLQDAASAEYLQQQLHHHGIPTEILCGDDAMAMVAAHEDVDTVMAAIVGAAGLKPTLAAVEAGKKVLLANKESLVMAGQLFMQAVAHSGAQLLPIDSEHNAIFQCLPQNDRYVEKQGVRKILLTGSGGPFRTLALDALDAVTPEQACAHPNWSMGRKISVDSATMMNKGLELIEACWLFNVTPDDIDVVVHPQSVIHSMVQYIDGTTLAQMGNPDMRTPIAYGLAWPERIESGVSDLNLFEIARLDFETADEQRFPCLRLAKEAFQTGKNAVTTLNAANEVAVEAFLQGQISFVDIANINEAVLAQAPMLDIHELDQVLQSDQTARRIATQLIQG